MEWTLICKILKIGAIIIGIFIAYRIIKRYIFRRFKFSLSPRLMDKINYKKCNRILTKIAKKENGYLFKCCTIESINKKPLYNAKNVYVDFVLVINNTIYNIDVNVRDSCWELPFNPLLRSKHIAEWMKKAYDERTRIEYNLFDVFHNSISKHLSNYKDTYDFISKGRTEENNDLQFSLAVDMLPDTNWDVRHNEIAYGHYPLGRNEFRDEKRAIKIKKYLKINKPKNIKVNI